MVSRLRNDDRLSHACLSDLSLVAYSCYLIVGIGAGTHLTTYMSATCQSNDNHIASGSGR